MTESRHLNQKVVACVAINLISTFILTVSFATARHFGQWAGQDAAIQQWFRNLTMPDFTAVSCCANGDGYWADSFEVREKHYVAIITDPRPDAPLHREHIASGTAIVIPDYKIKWDQGNPSGHGWVFIGLGGVVYCYLPPGGV